MVLANAHVSSLDKRHAVSVVLAAFAGNEVAAIHRASSVLVEAKGVLQDV
jgi:hypothetical protein